MSKREYSMSRGPQAATVLGERARVEGDLQLQHDAVIAGEVTGDLRVSGVVELTETARVGGDVTADTVRLAGRVVGAVVARDQTELRAGAAIGGGLTTGRLSAVVGATYDGPLRLGVTPAAPAPAARQEEARAAAPLRIKTSAEPAAHAPAAKQTGTDGGFVTGEANAALRPRRRVPAPPPTR